MRKRMRKAGRLTRLAAADARNYRLRATLQPRQPGGDRALLFQRSIGMVVARWLLLQGDHIFVAGGPRGSSIVLVSRHDTQKASG